jgi:thiamine biosynthesis protein ThiI
MTVFLIRYAEIALKGHNRGRFQRQLGENIRRTLNLDGTRLQHHHAQFILRAAPNEIQSFVEGLRKVFGVAWFASTQTCAKRMPDMIEASVQAAHNAIQPGMSFRIRANKADHSLPFSSVDIERQVGAAVLEATGASVNLENPDAIVYIDAAVEGAYVYTQKISGPGGLPVGTSGKVLSLISGGFDSIAASYLLAKRGAQVDFLHFHVFPEHNPVLDSKIAEIASKLSAYTFSERLFLSSYLPFEMRTLELQERDARYEAVAFRRMMLQVAEKLALEHGYQAIIVGDSLGQVASQTLENIVSVQDAVSIPVFRPLIGMDKVEITQQVREIGLFEAAAQEYKDCCAIIAAHPVIKAYLPAVRRLDDKLEMQSIVAESIENIGHFRIANLNGRGEIGDQTRKTQT